MIRRAVLRRSRRRAAGPPGVRRRRLHARRGHRATRTARVRPPVRRRAGSAACGPRGRATGSTCSPACSSSASAVTADDARRGARAAAARAVGGDWRASPSTATTCAAIVVIRPLGDPDDRLVAHDRPGPSGTVAADHVLGVSASTAALAGATIRRPIDAAFDLGTGCGVQAVHAAAHSAARRRLRRQSAGGRPGDADDGAQRASTTSRCVSATASTRSPASASS